MDKSRRVQIIEKNEPLTTVKLEDGTIIKIQIVVFGAHILLNEDGSLKLNSDGSPSYAINHNLALFIDTYETVPDGMKRN